MPGMCGWTGYHANSFDHPRAIAAMAARLRYAGGVRSISTGSCALALAAAGPSGQLARHGSVLVALWGRPTLEGSAAHEGGICGMLAEAWRQTPDSMCDALCGAFALAMVDTENGDTLLAVDRIGTFPLSYWQSGQALVFASHADALEPHPCVRLSADPQSLYDYVYFHMVPAPGHIYAGVRRLLPGELVLCWRGRTEHRRYWSMRFDEDVPPRLGALKQRFVELVRAGVRHSAQGGTVGAFLSGGTDSSTIAGMLAREFGRARTYSIGFDAHGYDEMAYARTAARHFGTEHHEYYVTPADVLAAIPKIALAFDQPFGNASAVPAYYCARMANQDGVSLMLGGDGGDELFGGNERYARQQLFAMYARLPARLRSALIEPAIFGMPLGSRIAPVRKARSYIGQARLPMPARLEAYNLLARYGPAQVFTTDFLAAADTGRPAAHLAQAWRQGSADSLVNRMLALDLKITLADNDLPKVLGACGLAGVDVAFPFLHRDVVAFSASLPPSYKLRNLRLRWFFKEALRGFLPDEIIAKKKHGFGLPFGEWLVQHPGLREIAGDSLAGLRRRGIVRAAFVDELLGRHVAEHAGYHGTMVWVLMMMEQWFSQREQPGVRRSSPESPAHHQAAS